MDPIFDHEKLRVYQEAIAFVSWWGDLADRVPGRLAVRDQMDRASTSIPLNIAEGNGKYSIKERCHYFDIARGSALGCAACLDVLTARRLFTNADVEPGKRHLHGVVSMLVRLMASVSARVSENGTEYLLHPRTPDRDTPQEHEQE